MDLYAFFVIFPLLLNICEIHVFTCSVVHSFLVLCSNSFYDFHNLFLHSTDDGHLGFSDLGLFQTSP